MFGDRCLYVNKSLNSICSLYKAIDSLQQMWTELLNSCMNSYEYGSFYNLFNSRLEEKKAIRFQQKDICVLMINENVTVLELHEVK